MIRQLFLYASIFALSSVTAQTDIKDSQDYPLLDRLPNYFITQYLEFEFDSEKFFTTTKTIKLRGKKLLLNIGIKKATTRPLNFLQDFKF